MNAMDILQTKRQNRRSHTTQELEWWISQYVSGKIPDYQMSAWLMAVCWRGMTVDETATLTRCMVQSGVQLEWNNTMDLVDKHSTGGVGDKISIVLAPLVASLGVKVPMMAGRGLGHTGGTIDKLESIPGYQTNLSIKDFQSIVSSEVGCSIVSTSSEMCVADRKLYALRDVTATVSCIPLQTSSILCKKIAEHPHSIVLDVKYGTAAFQPSAQDAMELAQSLIATAEANGLTPTTCFLTCMDSVIGHAVGNWLEIKECIQMLKGNSQNENNNGMSSTGTSISTNTATLRNLVVCQAAQMLQQSQKYKDWCFDDLVHLACTTLEEGKAFDTFLKMVQAHGGNVDVCNDVSTYPYQPQHTREIVATESGYLGPLDGYLVGTLCVKLGAGRQVAEDPVNPIAGMEFLVGEGDYVEESKTIIARIQTNKSLDVLEQVCNTLKQSLTYFATAKMNPPPFCISHRVTSARGVEEFLVPKCLQPNALTASATNMPNE